MRPEKSYAALMNLLSILLSAASMAATPSAQPSTSHIQVLTSPTELPAAHDRLRVFLGGSIDMGTAPNWQRDVIAALAAEDIVILNPRRDDWDKRWRPEADDPNFRQQVNWELSALESADIVLLYLSPGSQSPISLLELGLYARTGKLIVLCPEGYWRKGNVDLTVRRYRIEQVADVDQLIRATRERIGKLQRQQKPWTSYETRPENRTLAVSLHQRLDANHDSFVTYEEVTASAIALVSPTGRLPGPAMENPLARSQFNLADANHDGRISLQEAADSADRSFTEADTNHDGILSQEERGVYSARVIAALPAELKMLKAPPCQPGAACATAHPSFAPERP